MPDVKLCLFLKRNAKLPLTYLGVIPETSLRYYRVGAPIFGGWTNFR